MNFPFLWELLLGVYFVDQIENATFQHFENLGFGAFSLRNSSTGTSRHPMRASNDFSLSLLSYRLGCGAHRFEYRYPGTRGWTHEFYAEVHAVLLCTKPCECFY